MVACDRLDISMSEIVSLAFYIIVTVLLVFAYFLPATLQELKLRLRGMGSLAWIRGDSEPLLIYMSMV